MEIIALELGIRVSALVKFDGSALRKLHVPLCGIELVGLPLLGIRQLRILPWKPALTTIVDLKLRKSNSRIKIGFSLRTHET